MATLDVKRLNAMHPPSTHLGVATKAKNRNYDLKSDYMLDVLCDLCKEANSKSAKTRSNAPTSESQAHRVRQNQLVGSIFTTGIDTKLSPDLHTHLAGVTLPIFDATPNESEDSGDGHEIEKHASKISPNWQPTAAAALASVDAMRESNE
jgi:hypothetical protein